MEGSLLLQRGRRHGEAAAELGGRPAGRRAAAAAVACGTLKRAERQKQTDLRSPDGI